jgi:hypothetical protein
MHLPSGGNNYYSRPEDEHRGLLCRCTFMIQSTVSSDNLAHCQTNLGYLFVEDLFFKREQSAKGTSKIKLIDVSE